MAAKENFGMSCPSSSQNACIELTKRSTSKRRKKKAHGDHTSLLFTHRPEQNTKRKKKKKEKHEKKTREHGFQLDHGYEGKAKHVNEGKKKFEEDDETPEAYLERGHRRKKKKNTEHQEQESECLHPCKDAMLQKPKGFILDESTQDPNGSLKKKGVLNDGKSAQKLLRKDKKEAELEMGLKSETDMKPSPPTFSIAVAGSIVDNAQSVELATILAGQIARAAAIFRVNEIIVFDDHDGTTTPQEHENSEETGGLFMVRVLKYLEVPQYLRRALIPQHRSLRSVGQLPPLDAPHHARKHEWRPFRDGVVLGRKPLSVSGSCVDVGLDKDVIVGQLLEPGMRVTVAMGQTKANGAVLQVVDREAPCQAGLYWGYTVRYASCLSAVFDECPYEGKKYDFSIGTSEHGEKVKSMELVIPKCKHLLVAFGGLSGLEESLELDKRLKGRTITSLFHRYLNTCPDQGSRTIRTEEAILISLQYLQSAVQQTGNDGA